MESAEKIALLMWEMIIGGFVIGMIKYHKLWFWTKEFVETIDNPVQYEI